MGRTRRKVKAANGITSSPPPQADAGPSKVTFNSAELLAKADDLLAAYDFDLCRQFCERALQLEPNNVTALEMLGSAELETGLVEEATEHFMQVVAKATAADAALSSAHLYLAQLVDTPQASISHFRAAFELLRQRLDLVCPPAQQPARPPAAWSLEESDLRRACSRSLIGMTEVYMADLCFEPEASDLCTEYTTLATQLDPSDPDAFAARTSVLISQERPTEAAQALETSYSLWQDVEADALPSIETRLRCARLLLECQRPNDAVDVLRRLSDDDDENPDIFYLLGLALGIVAEAEEEEEEALLIEAREALETCLRIHQRSRDDEDEDEEGMFDHAKELLDKLIASGVPEPPPPEADGEGDEWIDEEDDDDADAMLP